MTGKTLQIPHPTIKGNPKTTLNAACAIGASSLTVVNTNQMISDEYTVIGSYGSPTAELILTGTISTDTAIPLATNTDFAHNAGDVIQHIYYNQIEISYSSNLAVLWESGIYASLSDAESAASWSVLATVDIEVTEEFTTYHDYEADRSYRARYKNSDETKYSDYFYVVLPTGYDQKTVAAIEAKAANMLNQKISSAELAQVTHEFCHDSINEGLAFIDSERKRWSHNAAMNGAFAQIISGRHVYQIIANVKNRNSNKAIWNLKINDGETLTYIDKPTWDIATQGWHFSRLDTQLTSASSSVTFESTANFDDSGTFDVWVSGVKMTVTYTANNRTTNVLTLSSASTEVTATADIDTYVLQNVSYGVPRRYTIINNYIYFDTVPDESIYLRNLSGDYYLKAQVVDSDDDYLRIEDPNIIIYYLRMCIALKTNNDTKYGQFKTMFDKALDNLKKNEVSGQQRFLRPKGWQYRTVYRSRMDDQDNDT